MSGFRPRLLPTLITIPIVLVCLGLGFWQLERLQWKRGLIAERTAAVAALPVAMPESLDRARALEWRRIAVDGVFANDAEILLHAIGAKGEAGFDVFTPLRAAGGRTIFVNRGFVPTELRDRSRRLAGEPTGSIHVGGRLRLAPERKPGLFVPDNQPGRGEWYWPDLPAMAAHAGLAEVLPFYVLADATPNPGGWPKGGAEPPPLRNQHLQYAITWFALAAAALVIYLLSQRGRREVGSR